MANNERNKEFQCEELKASNSNKTLIGLEYSRTDVLRSYLDKRGSGGTSKQIKVGHLRKSKPTRFGLEGAL